MVLTALYCFLVDASYARNYIVALIADSAMVIGGIWYLWRRWKLKQD
jgi:hypothetical protein